MKKKRKLPYNQPAMDVVELEMLFLSGSLKGDNEGYGEPIPEGGPNGWQ
mgnify:CR=1 FL=1